MNILNEMLETFVRCQTSSLGPSRARRCNCIQPAGYFKPSVSCFPGSGTVRWPLGENPSCQAAFSLHLGRPAVIFVATVVIVNLVVFLLLTKIIIKISSSICMFKYIQFIYTLEYMFCFSASLAVSIVHSLFDSAGCTIRSFAAAWRLRMLLVHGVMEVEARFGEHGTGSRLGTRWLFHKICKLLLATFIRYLINGRKLRRPERLFLSIGNKNEFFIN